ncbi:MAG: FAD-dependent oxidoreductase [Acidobacteriota bacterium]
MHSPTKSFGDRSSIAIVGGGCAGVAAAVHLSDREFDITLFEQNDRIGGKCQSFVLGEHRLNVGATLLTRAATKTREMMKRAGLDMVKIEKDTLIYTRSKGLVPVSEHIASRPLADAWPLLSYRRALGEFRHALRRRDVGEFAEPFHDWCASRGLARLEEFFYFVIYPFGYPPLATMPTWYVMRYINEHAVSLFFLKGIYDLVGRRIPTYNVDGGYEAIWRSILSKEPAIRTRLGVTVTRIERSSDAVRIETTDGGFRFDEVALAVSPDRILQVLDTTAAEKALLSAIAYSPYASIVCRGSGAPADQAIFLEDRRVPLVISDTIADGEDPALTFYVQGDFTRGEIPALLHAAKPPDWQLGEVLHVSSWTNYFPHFPSEALRSNPFQALERLQHKNRTTYFGGWCDFETVEATLDHAQATVERYFGPVEGA